MKNKILISTITILLLVSCTQDKKLAQHFIKRSNDVKVALFVPNALIKNNLRNDTIPPELDTLTNEGKIDYLERQIRIVNKIDDTKFIDILYFSMEKELRSFGMDVEYWPTDSVPADSTRWIIDIPKIEVTEYVENKRAAAQYYNEIVYVTIPVDVVNVATWFDVSDGLTDETVFTEQNYSNDFDGYFDVDSNGKVYAKIFEDSIDMEGFYRFGSMLGRLYAGYCFDYLMNGYIDKNLTKVDTTMKFRYNPYEQYIYKTDRDRLIPVK